MQMLLAPILTSNEASETTRRVLAKCLPYPGGPNDYQTRCDLASLNGKDVLCLNCTGTGKTGLLCFPLLAALELLEEVQSQRGGTRSLRCAESGAAPRAEAGGESWSLRALQRNRAGGCINV